MNTLRWAARKFLESNGKTKILSPLLCSGEHLPSKLMYTIKSHKPPRAVKLRLIHGGHNHPFRGASAVINNILQPYVDSQKHMCKSSQKMRKALEEAKLKEDTLFVKADIENFYMERTHPTLVRHAFTNL